MKRFVEGVDRGQSTLFPESLEARTQPAIPQEFQSSTNSVYVAFDVLIGEAEDVRVEPSSFFKAREKTLLA
jgi:hypothetical protein